MVSHVVPYSHRCEELTALVGPVMLILALLRIAIVLIWGILLTLLERLTRTVQDANVSAAVPHRIPDISSNCYRVQMIRRLTRWRPFPCASDADGKGKTFRREGEVRRELLQLLRFAQKVSSPISSTPTSGSARRTNSCPSACAPTVAVVTVVPTIPICPCLKSQNGSHAGVACLVAAHIAHGPEWREEGARELETRWRRKASCSQKVTREG